MPSISSKVGGVAEGGGGGGALFYLTWWCASHIGTGEDCGDGTETLSRNHPIFEILRNRHLEVLRSPEAKEGHRVEEPNHSLHRHKSPKALERLAAKSSPRGGSSSSEIQVVEQMEVMSNAAVQGGLLEKKGSSSGASGSTDSCSAAVAGLLEAEKGETVKADDDRFLNDYYYGYVDRLVLKVCG